MRSEAYDKTRSFRVRIETMDRIQEMVDAGLVSQSDVVDHAVGFLYQSPDQWPVAIPANLREEIVQTCQVDGGAGLHDAVDLQGHQDAGGRRRDSGDQSPALQPDGGDHQGA